jgi:hypothetical protein
MAEAKPFKNIPNLRSGVSDIETLLPGDKDSRFRSPFLTE